MATITTMSKHFETNKNYYTFWSTKIILHYETNKNLHAQKQDAPIIHLSWVVVSSQTWNNQSTPSHLQSNSYSAHLSIQSYKVSCWVTWPHQTTCAALLLQGVPGVPQGWGPCSIQSHWHLAITANIPRLTLFPYIHAYICSHLCARINNHIYLYTQEAVLHWGSKRIS